MARKQPQPPPSGFDPRRTFDARDVRQGEVVLRHRWSRAVFIGALAGIVLLVLLLRLAPWF